jgi:hypothetical protein
MSNAPFRSHQCSSLMLLLIMVAVTAPGGHGNEPLTRAPRRQDPLFLQGPATLPISLAQRRLLVLAKPSNHPTIQPANQPTIPQFLQHDNFPFKSLCYFLPFSHSFRTIKPFRNFPLRHTHSRLRLLFKTQAQSANSPDKRTHLEYEGATNNPGFRHFLLGFHLPSSSTHIPSSSS